MNSSASAFYGARLKVRRAEYHIQKLDRVFARYISDNVKRIRRKASRGRKQSVVHIGHALPEHVPTLVGDAIHNLRAALDYAYCTLVERNGGTIDNSTMFPFSVDQAKLEEIIEGRRKKQNFLPAEAVLRTIVGNLEPYRGGRLGLYELHRLDITDKHRVLIPTASTFRAENVNIGPVAIKGLRITRHGNGTGAAISAAQGSVQLDGNPKSALDFCFDQGQPFEGESVVKILRNLANNVSSALDALENHLL